MSIDLDHALRVARRQAFGSGFERRSDDAASAANLKDGRLTLSPHPEVRLTLPIEWEQDPIRQRNWRAQLHMLRWLDPIRRLAADGDASFMPLWSEIAQDWVSKNPPTVSSTTYAWGDMVDALRAHTLLLGLPYVDDPEWILDALTTHGEWLADPDHLGHSNHALHQHASLLMIGSALGNAEWMTTALERIRVHAASEFDEEGINQEAAPGYWLLNYRWVRDVARRVELEGHDAARIRAAIAKVPVALAHASRPDGVLEVIGDTAPRTSLKSDQGPPALTYVATEGADGSPPDATTVVYRAGYAFGRSGWGETDRRPVEETFYSLRFGPADAIHGHMDGGSITYFAQGRPILTEAGKYAYVSDKMRKYVLGRVGHNVLHIRGIAYDKTMIVELVHAESNERFDYYRLRDRGYRGVTIERDLVFARGSEALLIVDTVRASKEVVAESRLHLDQTCAVELDGLRLGISSGAAKATLLWGGRAPKIELTRGQQQPFDGWLSPSWGEAAETTVVKAVQSGTRFRITTAVCPGHVDADRLPAVAGEDGATFFTVEGNGVRERIGLLGGRIEVTPASDGARGMTVGSGRVPAERMATVEEIERYESENSQARSALTRSDRLDRSAVSRVLASRVRSGFDYGASATLRDLALLDGGRDAAELDSRTRTALYPPTPDLSRASGRAPHHFYPAMPRTFALDGGASVHVVEAGPLALPVRFDRANSDVLVVSLHGALNRSKTQLPRFERVRSLTALGVNVLAVADPTLDLHPDLSLGWYLGTRTVDLHETIARVVSIIREQIGSRRTIMLGSSGGGFAALHLAAFLPDATALVMNPQTDVSRYHPRFSRRALDLIFGVENERTESIRRRISVSERYASARDVGRIRYVANRGDVHHVREHAEPLWAELGPWESRLEVTWLDLGNGHIAPDLATVNTILEEEMGR